MSDLLTKAEQIARLNDRLRRTLAGGQVLTTQGVHALGVLFVWRAIAAVQAFDTFTPDNDPHRERDFGTFTLDGRKLFWKIDYYDPTMRFPSEDPSDPAQTCRVLTVMLSEEY